MSDYLKKYRLRGFTLGVRELTPEEWDRQSEPHQRDYLAVEIRAVGDTHALVMCVGSPIIMTAGHKWDEDSAARSAISFASVASCWDDERDAGWVYAHGEDLTNEAFCHRVLGKELRKG